MIRWLILLLVSVLVVPGFAVELRHGDTVTINQGQIINDDLVVAGGTVYMRGTVEDDLVVAGGTVEVDGPVIGNIIAAGGTVTVHQPVGGTVYVAGGTVKLESNVGRNAIVTGGTVELLHAATITKDMVVSGGNAIISGTIGRDLHAAAGTLSITDGAVVHGNLIAMTRHPEIATGAVIGGQRLIEQPRHGYHRGYLWWFRWHLLMGIMLFITAAVFIALAPRLTEQTQAVIRTHPWGSLLAGLVILIVVPIAALIVLFIVPPLALIAMALYLIAIYFAPIFLAMLVARLILRNPQSSPYLALLIGVALLIVLHWIPVLGGIVGFIVMLIGLGALFLALQSRLARPIFPISPASPTQ